MASSSSQKANHVQSGIPWLIFPRASTTDLPRESRRGASAALKLYSSYNNISVPSFILSGAPVKLLIVLVYMTEADLGCTLAEASRYRAKVLKRPRASPQPFRLSGRLATAEIAVAACDFR